MQANYVQRLRLSFTKTGPTRYIGHLDLARTLERALNRAKIPIAYTQGFNQRPRMALAAALPLGFTSSHELADILMAEEMEPDAARRQMMTRMAPGIEVYEVVEVPISEPALQTLTDSSTYRVTLLDKVDVTRLKQDIDEMLAAESRVRRKGHGRKRKEYDLRPLILDLKLTETPEGEVQLHMHLTLRPAQTGRPDEVLRELGLDPVAARIHRQRIFLQDENREG